MIKALIEIIVTIILFALSLIIFTRGRNSED
jgi:hypothetical protein